MADGVRRRLLAVLCDLSGTIHVEDSGILGCVEAVNRLRSMPNVRLRFVTNTTKESQRALHDRLHKIGFDIKPHEIYTSLTAARRLVDSRKLRPMLLLEQSAMEDFAGVDISNPNAVVVGLSPSQFHYERLNEAFRLLLDGAKLIAIHKGRYFQRKDGLVLSIGPFVQGLEYAADCESEVVGKPSASFFNGALDDLKQCEPDSASVDWLIPVMIGDDARDDVGGAQKNAHFRGILVKTGKYREGDENKVDKPFRVCSDFPDAVGFIESLLLD